MLDILFRRRSIRKYIPVKVEPNKVQQLIKAALLSPSSKGSRPWQFIVVDNPEVLEKLALSKPGTAIFLKGAALGIVVLVDSEKSDVWVEDAAIAAIILHLTAESMGLGSCWIQIRERHYSNTETAEQYVRRVLEIPGNLKVEAIISIGYPESLKPPYEDGDLDFTKIHINQYGSKYSFLRLI